MSYELTIKNKELIEAIENKNIADIIKPLVNEIHLFDTFIAGTTHLKEPEVLEKVNEGDKLSLVREDNKFDAKAILIQNAEGR